MDTNELCRMFDRLEPAPEREGELLDQLLRDQARRKRPVKNLKNLVCAAAAAALLVTACAAAAAPGMNRWLLDYFGVAPEDSRSMELLAAGALPLDITVEDSGAALRVTQVLRDQCSILVLAEFTAPEGTSLVVPEDNASSLGFWGGGLMTQVPVLLDQDGEDLGFSGSSTWMVQEDEDPQDNRVTAFFSMSLSVKGDRLQNASSMWLPVEGLSYYSMETRERSVVYPGDWSCEVPLPQQDTGWAVQPETVAGRLDNADITVKDVYLSPMTLQITLEREFPVADDPSEEGEAIYSRWLSVINIKRVTLTTRDGRTIELENFGGVAGAKGQTMQFRLAEVTDPEQFQGGTLTLRIGDGVCDIPLDGLTAVDPQEP